MYQGVDRISQAYQRVTKGTRANKYAARARSANTWLVCDTAVRSFTENCDAKGFQPMPASIEAVEDWVMALADKGLRISTIRTYVGSVCTWHRVHKHELRTKMLMDTLKGIANTSPPPMRSKPLMAAMLHEILDHLDAGDLRSVRSGALLSLMLACALRGTEATAIDLGRLGNDRSDDINAGFLVDQDEGLEVVLTKSKTSPNEAVLLPVPEQRMSRTVAWVREWVERAGIAPGTPLFRSFRKGRRVSSERLSSREITPIVRKCVREHLIRGGMDPDKAHVASLDYTSHACRSGFLSTGADAGTKEHLLRERSRHRNANVAAGYVRTRSGWNTDWGFEL